MEILILAAGKSSRFKYQNKILAPFWGARAIDLTINSIKNIGHINIILNQTVYNEIQDDNITKYLQSSSGYGTGFAVQDYLNQSSYSGELLVVPGDAPLINTSDMQTIINTSADIAIGILESPSIKNQYGRIIFDQHQNIIKIAEYAQHQENTNFVNSGIIYFNQKAIQLVRQLKHNQIGEIYLTDIIELAAQSGLTIKGVPVDADALGFNSMEELHILLAIAQNKWRKQHIKNGVILLNPESTYFSHDTVIEPHVLIEPNCYFGREVVIKSDTIIKANSYLCHCTVSGEIGPFAHIRSGIIHNATIGAFVEIKNANIQEGVKIKHLAYVGDANIAKNVNIGAGVVFCSFDGEKKYNANVEEGAFIGANSSLIAPIQIGKNAFLAAGGTYTQDIPSNALAIARTRQIVKENRSKRAKQN
jgi:bifunctional UDP-N-acetylglucosamine pyrophosphorylase/glucosamine-1-phosphate N-acetyltransferase